MTWTLLHARLHQTLRQRHLLARGSRALVAVSGGQDSLCLLKLLLDLQPQWNWHLAIAHCNHRWSVDAGLAEWVQQIAQQWQLPFYLAAESVAETEAAAREWRYQALAQLAADNGFAAVVTGHTKSDRAETLLYNLVRGSGADGLQALTWQRSLTEQVIVVRPLLTVSRTETLEFCRQFQLPVWEDAANQNLKYARNRIRAELLPYLQRHFNPQVETALAQTAELLRADVEYLETTAQALLQQVRSPLGLNRLRLRDVPLALQRRVVRQFLHQVLPQAPNFEEIESVTNLIQAPNRTRTSSLSGGASAEAQGDWIIFNQQLTVNNKQSDR
ncbi:MAG: tRNA lysidine(34) synthetase TilS [Cyanophyceae cyanobacterium]